VSLADVRRALIRAEAAVADARAALEAVERDGARPVTPGKVTRWETIAVDTGHAGSWPVGTRILRGAGVTATLGAYFNKVDEGWFSYLRGGYTSTHDDEAGAIARIEKYARDRGWTIEPAPVDARAIRIDDADPQLSVRASACCRNAGWTTLGQLADLTPAEMLRARNLGRKVLNEIRALLAANGLSLRGEA
jgi:hypothetical protein